MTTPGKMLLPSFLTLFLMADPGACQDKVMSASDVDKRARLVDTRIDYIGAISNDKFVVLGRSFHVLNRGVVDKRREVEINAEDNTGFSKAAANANVAWIGAENSKTKETTLVCYDFKERKVARAIPTKTDGWVAAMRLSGDGAQLACLIPSRKADDEATIVVLNAQTGEHIKKLEFKLGALSIAFTANGKKLAVGCTDGSVSVFDTTTWKEDDRKRIGSTSTSIHDLLFIPNSEKFAFVSWDRVGVFDFQKNKMLWSSDDHCDDIEAIAVAPDGIHLATGSIDRTIRIWRVNDGKCLAILKKAHVSFVYALAFTPDGKTLYSAGGDKTLYSWDVEFLSKRE